MPYPRPRYSLHGRLAGGFCDQTHRAESLLRRRMPARPASIFQAAGTAPVAKLLERRQPALQQACAATLATILSNLHVAFVLDMRFFASNRVRDLLSALHFALRDSDLLVHDGPLFNLDLLFSQRNGYGFVVLLNWPVRRPTIHRCSLDSDLLSSDRHLDGALLSHHMLAELDLAGLDVLLVR